MLSKKPSRQPMWMAVLVYGALVVMVGVGVVVAWGSPGLLQAPAAASSAPAAPAAPAGQGANWVALAPLGEPRQEVGVAEVGGQVYVVGGFRGDTAPTGTAEAYDIASDSWR